MADAPISEAEIQSATEGNTGAEGINSASAITISREDRLSQNLDKKAETLSRFVPVEGADRFANEIKRLRKLREAAAKNKKMMTRNLRNRERQKGRLTKKAAVFSDEDLLQVLSDRALRTIKRQVESHKTSERRRAERLLSHASDASS